MKKLVKKLSVVLIIVIMIILTSQVWAEPAIPCLENDEVEVSNISGFIIYLIQIGASLISISFFVINLIKIIVTKMNVNYKVKYFIIAFFIMILGLSSAGIIQLTQGLIDGINMSSDGKIIPQSYNYTPTVIGIIILIVSIILNILLLIRINKRNKINRRIADEKNCKED